MLHVAGPTLATARRPHSARFDGKHIVHGSPSMFPCCTWLSVIFGRFALSVMRLVRHALLSIPTVCTTSRRLRQTVGTHLTFVVDQWAGSLSRLGFTNVYDSLLCNGSTTWCRRPSVSTAARRTCQHQELQSDLGTLSETFRNGRQSHEENSVVLAHVLGHMGTKRSRANNASNPSTATRFGQPSKYTLVQQPPTFHCR